MKKLFLVVIALCLSAVMLSPMPGESRSVGDKIQRKKRQVEKKRAREGVLTQDISGYSTRIQTLQADIRGYASREVRLQGSLQQKRAEVQRVADKLQVAQDRLVRLRARLKEATDVLSIRLVEMYKADEPDILTVVLESNGFADLLDRTAFIEKISAQDRAIVTRVRVLKKQTTALANQLEELRGQKQAAANAILAQKNQVAQARAAVVERQSALANARARRRTVLASVRDSRSNLEGDLKSLQKEQAAVQAKIQGAQGGGGGAGPIKRGSGNLIWPVNGPVVSPFGMRWGRLHAGIDIAVPSGTPVRASASGNVIIAGVVGGYGNYICIAHSGSLSTCYAHNTSLGVSQGQSVSQGQVIASSGCTGHCLGPHVHFETRINGSPVDPMGYL
jgi:murein DD-endopeptidase MepM/ murein hydrolase activator NlpD